jgi:serine/threonine protein kinase
VNVARLIDSGTFTNGIQFLVSTYFDGLSVRDILDIYGKFPAERAGRVIRQAASALGQAHQEGILHRDVRPENLIIDTDGDVEQVVLVNFGASNGEATEMNAAYKAPEILDGRIGTAASDIFSLAVVAYEMVTGRLPFEGESTKEIVRSQYAGLSLRPTDVDDELPEAVDEVLEKAFSYNAAERYTKARDFGDAFSNAVNGARLGPSVKAKGTAASTAAVKPIVTTKPVVTGTVETLEPAVKPTRSVEPAWKQRSPEPPEVEDPRTRTAWILGILVLLALIGAGWWYIVNHPAEQPLQNSPQDSNTNSVPVNTISPTTEMPPLPRTIPQPPNTVFVENSKANLKGDLLANFVGFSLYYPKDWKSNGAQPGTGTGRGKFLDISRETSDGRPVEQMLVSYYPSKGTYSEDAANFPQLVKESNETLKKILPGYQDVSEGEIKVNGAWHAYELKFQAGGTSPDGDKLIVWGRRIFIPAARPGTRNGFEITMLATSLSQDVKSVDDVGVKGELAPILYSFEPNQNF